MSSHVKPTTANVQVFETPFRPWFSSGGTIKIPKIMRDKLRCFQMLFADDGHTFSV
jgi:hypothetical protein